MRLLGTAAAAAALLALAAPAAAAGPASVRFLVDVTDSTVSGFTPFSFIETWTFTDANNVTVDDIALTTAMKALMAPGATFHGHLGDQVGEFRDFQTHVLLEDHAFDVRPFNVILTATAPRGTPFPHIGSDLAPELSAFGAFDFTLVGPVHTDDAPVGENRDLGHGGIVQGHFTGTAKVLGAPEPGAWALMLAGFGLVGAALRGRRRKLA